MSTPAPDLAVAFALLQQHSRAASSRLAPPSTAHWHSLPRRLRDIREAAEGGAVDCRAWLEQHRSAIRYVEECRRVYLDEALRGIPKGSRR